MVRSHILPKKAPNMNAINRQGFGSKIESAAQTISKTAQIT
jgi:hypothetical protein